MNKKINIILFIGFFLFIALGEYLNIKKQKNLREKLKFKVEF